jgi:hypothetical protein
LHLDDAIAGINYRFDQVEAYARAWFVAARHLIEGLENIRLLILRDTMTIVRHADLELMAFFMGDQRQFYLGLVYLPALFNKLLTTLVSFSSSTRAMSPSLLQTYSNCIFFNTKKV